MNAWALTADELFLAVSEECGWGREDDATRLSQLLRRQLLTFRRRPVRVVP